MRVLLQRVKQAKVVIEKTEAGVINHGLLIFLGITHEDTEADIHWLINKIIKLRIFNDEAEKMNLSVKDVGGDVLIVSQFTLFAAVNKGNRPSYNRSASPDIAIPLYEQFVSTFKELYEGNVQTGVFGAMMEVSLVNDGPVTIWMDSREQTY